MFVSAFLSRNPTSPTQELIRRWQTSDPDDDAVLACAVVGQADYLVSDDPHLESLGEHRGIKITKALPFLWAVRGNRSPD